MPRKILLVDDDALMRRSLAFNLNQAGYETLTASNAEDALAMVQCSMADLVLLDIGLPGMDGLDALKQLKSRHGLPVIFLTSRRRELDEVLGLELGADDYVTKPFDLDVLLARIKVALRRSVQPETAGEPQPLQAGALKIDPLSHSVTVSGKAVELSPREFDLLHTLALEPNRVFSVDELLNRVWGAEFLGQPQVVYVHIRWLREKIEQDPKTPRLLQTVRGVGYKLTAEG